MTLEEWLKGEEEWTMWTTKQTLLSLTGDWSDHWLDVKDGHSWAVDVLEDGTAITYCVDK